MVAVIEVLNLHIGVELYVNLVIEKTAGCPALRRPEIMHKRVIVESVGAKRT
jgi:hypothetical protein